MPARSLPFQSSADTIRFQYLRLAAAAVILLAVGMWAWAAGLSGPYHFDDQVTPLNDPASQSLEAWRQYLPVTLRPLTKLSYALEAEGGWAAEPAPRRVGSILMHAVSAGFLFLLIIRLAPQSATRSAPLGAGFLAALWFIHPVHADAVLMLSGRSAVLSGVFLLAALLALDRARPWFAAALFVLACLSRETALAGLLPLAVMAASRPGAALRSTLRELAPALLGGVLIVIWILTTPRYMHLAEYSFLGRPFWSSVASQVGAVPVGLGLLFNPSALSIDYGLPLPSRVSETSFVLGLVLYLAALAGVLLSIKRSRAIAVGLALWLAALLPTQSVVPKLDALTNKPLGLALAGLLLVAVPLGVAIGERLRSAWTLHRRNRMPDSWLVVTRPAAAASAMLLLVLLAAATARRSELFESELAMWRDAAGKSRVNARPHLQYARLLIREDKINEARRVLATAGRIDPFSSQIAALARVYPPTEVTR